MISVTANLVPGEVARMCAAFTQGTAYEEARDIHQKPPAAFHRHVHRYEPRAGKDGALDDGAYREELRLPLVEMVKPEIGERLEEALKEYGLIK